MMMGQPVSRTVDRRRADGSGFGADYRDGPLYCVFTILTCDAAVGSSLCETGSRQMQADRCSGRGRSRGGLEG